MMSGKKVEVGGEGRRMTTRNIANEGNEHPLMNHLVLETVFEYCNVKDLKVVRLVTPVWRDCARKKWNKSVKLRVSRVPEWSSDDRGKEKYRRFLQMVKIYHPLMKRSQGNWTTFCAQMKTLELACVTFPTVQSLRNALFRCFPNLESLILRPGNNILGYRHVFSAHTRPQLLAENEQQRNLKHLKLFIGREFPLSWLEVLSRFPSLERIEMETSAARMRTETVFQAINQIREEDPSKLNLKHITIRSTDRDGYITPAAITTLMDKRLQLETIELEPMGLHGSRPFTSTHEILQVHAGTLKILAIENGPNVPFPQGYGFPELTELQELRMKLCFSLESIEFLQFTPNLRKLELNLNFPIGYGRIPQSNFARFPILLNACKHLEILDSQRTFSSKNWKSLIQWTPNLEFLKIFDVDNNRFVMICEGWSNLVELHVERSKIDGSGITGWDDEDVQRLDSMRSALPKWTPITVPRANITALKHLRIFKMTASSSQPPIKLGRAAGLHGIEMLPDLRGLRIQDYKILPKHRDYWEKLHERYLLPLL